MNGRFYKKDREVVTWTAVENATVDGTGDGGKESSCMLLRALDTTLLAAFRCVWAHKLTILLTLAADSNSAS